MEPSRSRSALPSPRAVLGLGAAGLLWLVLAGLFILQLDAEARSDRPSVPSAYPAVAAAVPPAPEHPAAVEPSAEADSEVLVPAPPVEPARLTPPPFALAGAPSAPEDHPSLENAYDEPLMDEVLALIDAVHLGIGRPDSAIPAPLSRYVKDLVQRLNADGETFMARLYAPDAEAARVRGVRFHSLLVEAGMRPWLLAVSGEYGASRVAVERT